MDVGSHQNVCGTFGDNREGHLEDAWWSGFGCDQRDDLIPLDAHHSRGDKNPAFGVDDPTHKAEAFVYGDCMRLTAQLMAIGEDRAPRAADPGSTLSAASSLEYRRCPRASAILNCLRANG